MSEPVMPSGFSYVLQPALTRLGHKADTAWRELAAALALEGVARERLAATSQRQQELEHQLGPQTGQVLDPVRQLMAWSHHQALQTDLGQARAALAQCRDQTQACRRRLRELEARKKALQEHRNNACLEHQQELERRAQTQADEHWTLQGTRRLIPSNP